MYPGRIKMENRINDAKELLSLIYKSPTAFHVIDNAKGILDSALIAFSVPKTDHTRRKMNI